MVTQIPGILNACAFCLRNYPIFQVPEHFPDPPRLLDPPCKLPDPPRCRQLLRHLGSVVLRRCHCILPLPHLLPLRPLRSPLPMSRLPLRLSPLLVRHHSLGAYPAVALLIPAFCALETFRDRCRSRSFPGRRREPVKEEVDNEARKVSRYNQIGQLQLDRRITTYDMIIFFKFPLSCVVCRCDAVFVSKL